MNIEFFTYQFVGGFLILVIIFVGAYLIIHNREHILHKINYKNWFKIAKKPKYNINNLVLSSNEALQFKRYALEIEFELQSQADKMKALEKDYNTLKIQDLMQIQKLEKMYSEKVFNLQKRLDKLENKE